MVDSFVDALTAAAVLLTYVLLVESMTAAILLLCEFIVLRVRALWSLLVPVERTEPTPVEPQGQEPAYRIGGGLMRW